MDVPKVPRRSAASELAGLLDSPEITGLVTVVGVGTTVSIGDLFPLRPAGQSWPAILSRGCGFSP